MKRELPYAATVLALTLALPLSAHAKCSSYKAQAAEQATDSLSSWKDVHAFFRQYGTCIDGGVAEGLGDRVQTLWDEHWSSLPEMLSLSNRDPSFRRLMVRFARSEAFPRDRFERVLKNATDSCPPGGRAFCEVIKSAGRSPDAA